MHASPALDAVGWIATAVFVGSYFCGRPAALRATQMAGAAIWIVYGCALGAAPVVAANVLVLAAAGLSIVRARRASALVVEK